MNWTKRYHEMKATLALGLLALSGIALADELQADAPVTSSVQELASETERIHQIVEKEKQIQKLTREKQYLYSSLSKEGRTSATAQDPSFVGRDARIKAHQERIQSIIEESRQRRANNPGETFTLQEKAPLGNPGSASRDQRIQEHQARIQQILDESQARRDANAAGETATSKIKMKVTTSTATSEKTLEERRKDIENTRQRLEEYIKAQNEESN